MNGFLIDLDGTLYRGHEPIPGAAAFLQWLHQEQLPYLGDEQFVPHPRTGCRASACARH